MAWERAIANMALAKVQRGETTEEEAREWAKAKIAEGVEGFNRMAYPNTDGRPL